jgi:hypothetical protein
VARVISDSAGRQRPFRARAETTEARNGVVKRRPHRSTPARESGRGNRTDQGARLIRGIGQKSVVRISGSSISFASHSPEPRARPPADLVTIALTRCDKSAYRYPQDVGLRLTVRSIDEERGRRERVRDSGDRGVKATASRVR